LDLSIYSCLFLNVTANIQKNQVMISRKISKHLKEITINSLSLQIQKSTLGEGEKRRKETGNEKSMTWRLKGVCFGLVLLSRRKGSLTFTHSCKVTIYICRPFLLLAVLRLGKIREKTTTSYSLFSLFFSFVSHRISLKWNKRHSLTSFFVLTSRIRIFSIYLYIFKW